MTPIIQALSLSLAFWIRVLSGADELLESLLVYDGRIEEKSGMSLLDKALAKDDEIFESFPVNDGRIEDKSGKRPLGKALRPTKAVVKRDVKIALI